MRIHPKLDGAPVHVACPLFSRHKTYHMTYHMTYPTCPSPISSHIAPSSPAVLCVKCDPTERLREREREIKRKEREIEINKEIINKYCKHIYINNKCKYCAQSPLS